MVLRFDEAEIRNRFSLQKAILCPVPIAVAVSVVVVVVLLLTFTAANHIRT